MEAREVRKIGSRGDDDERVKATLILHGPLGVARIIDYTGIPETTLKRHLRALESEGAVVHNPDGTYEVRSFEVMGKGTELVGHVGPERKGKQPWYYSTSPDHRHELPEDEPQALPERRETSPLSRAGPGGTAGAKAPQVAYAALAKVRVSRLLDRLRTVEESWRGKVSEQQEELGYEVGKTLAEVTTVSHLLPGDLGLGRILKLARSRDVLDYPQREEVSRYFEEVLAVLEVIGGREDTTH